MKRRLALTSAAVVVLVAGVLYTRSTQEPVAPVQESLHPAPDPPFSTRPRTLDQLRDWR